MIWTILPGGNVVMADSAPTIFIAERFDTYADGVKPASFNLPGSDTVGRYDSTNGVVTISDGNKALWFGGGNTEGHRGITNANGFASKDQKQYVISASYMTGEQPLDMAIRIAGMSGSAFSPYAIRNGVIYANNTTKIGTVSKTTFTKIDLVVDFGKEIFSIYVNDKLVAEDYKISADITIPIKHVQFVPFNMSEGRSIYLDDFFFYTGNDIIDFPAEVFNTDCSDIADFRTERYNFTLMNQKNLNGSYAYSGASAGYYKTDTFRTQINGTTYTGVGAQDADIISLNRLDWNNAYRENDWITIRKVGNDAVTLQFLTNYGCLRSRYYSMTMKLSSDDLPSEAEVFRVYGERLNGDKFSSINQVIMTLNNKGELITSNGVKIGTVTKGAFLEFTCAFDMSDKKVDIYVGGGLKTTVPLNKEMLNLNGAYLTIPATSTNGNLIIDGVMWDRLDRPYSTDGSHIKSAYPDDSLYEEYLEGKHAVSGFRGTYYGTSGKMYIEDTFFFDKANKDFKNIYLTKSTMSKVLDINENDIEYLSDDVVKYKGKEYSIGVNLVSAQGELLASFGPFAEKVLGLDVVYYEDMGLVLADDVLNINPDTERRANDMSVSDGKETTLLSLAKYMHFDRPDVQQLKADFFANNAGKENQHPRLGITKERIEELKVLRTQDEELDAMIRNRINYADGNLETLPWFNIDRPIRGLNANVYLPLSDRIEAFACAYWFTGEQKYVDAAFAQFEEIEKWQDWNEMHEIDMGRILTAMAYLYDWCHEGLTPEQRQRIVDKTTELAVLPTYEQLTMQSGSQASWLYNMSNFNAMCSAGPLIWLAATAEVAPEITWETAELSIRGTEYFLQSMMPDGAAADSPSYWKEHMFAGMGYWMLQEVFGNTYGIEQSPGLENTSSWIISMMHPAGQYSMHDTPNYDCTGTNYFESQALSVFAQMYDNPNWYAYRKQRLKDEMYRTTYVYDIISYMEGGSIDFIPLDYLASGMDIFTAKGSTTDKYSLYLAAHGGVPSSFHSHEDVGTFVYFNDGVAWASELGTEDYQTRNLIQKIPQQMFLDRIEGHNGMMFNPTTERLTNLFGSTTKKAYAKVENYISKERGSFIVYDLTDVYSEDVTSYKRGITTADDRRSAIIRDEFTVKQENTEGYWFMHTVADEFEIVDKNTIIMEKDGKRQMFELYTDLTDYELFVTEAKTMWPEHDLGDKNVSKKYEKLVIKFNTSGTNYIHVKMYNPDEKGMSEADKLLLPVNQWTIPDGELPEREVYSFTSYTTSDGLSSTFNTITYEEGTQKPYITSVNLVDETMSYEIIHEESREVIRVYSSKNPGTYQDLYIPYECGTPTRTMDQYPEGTFSEYEIVNVTEDANHTVLVWAEAICDGEYGTRWGCADIGDYIVLDLGESKEITHFAAAQWEGANRTFYYQVLMSEDGINYNVVKDVTSYAIDGADGTCQLFAISPTKARYVKILNTGGNTTTKAQNFYEFKVLKQN